ncbi:MAG: hypothetical protein Salg2KO_20640 [Salibacteraceae bacterium]
MVSSNAFSETFDCGQDSLVVSTCSTYNSIEMYDMGMDEIQWNSSLTIDTTGGTDTVSVSIVLGSSFITVIGTDTNTNESDTLVLQLIVNSPPSAQINSSAEIDNNFVCLGESATLTVTTEIATLDFITWQTDSTLDTLMGSSVVATPDSTTTYVATVTNTFGCTASASKQVAVGTTYPTFTVDVDPPVICPGDSAEFDGSSTSVAISRWEWSPSGTLSSSTGEVINAGPSTTTSYTVTATSQGCSTDSTFTLEVLDAPAMSVSQTATGSIKLDETTTITVDCPTCLQYVWSLPSSTLTTTANVQTISPNIPGVNVISITGKDSNACRSAVSINVTVDSAFAGEPWPPAAVEEIEANAVKVINLNNEIVIRSASNLDRVMVYNLLGSIIFQSGSIADTELKVPASDWSAGMYIVSIRTASGIESTEKVYLQ